MNYKSFKYDFVSRTKALIERFSNDTEYEVTLLINCLYAFITVPTELAKSDSGYEDFKPFFLLKLHKYGIIKEEYNDEKLFRAIRNALSHMNIEIGDDNGIISSIRFMDKKKNDEYYHTIVEFTIINLKSFVSEISNKYLEITRQNENIN